MENIIGQKARAWDIGYKGHETYVWSACKKCGKERWVVVLKGKPSREHCKKCGMLIFNTGRKGNKSPMWKGGRCDNNGYINVYLPEGTKFESMRYNCPSRYLLEHRLVMAQYLDRPLQSFEIVHHKDGNRSNNDINNLELTTRGSHSIEHSKGYGDGFKKGYKDGLAFIKKEGLNGKK